jgi:hypothetical protein
MPKQVELQRDPDTGRIKSVHVRGIKGRACEEVERIVAELYAEPTHSDRTEEYYQRSQARPQVKRTEGG